MSEQPEAEPKPSKFSAVWSNVFAWLSSRKTKDAITASIPVLLAAFAKEIDWFTAVLTLAGIWTGKALAQGVADHGVERAKIQAEVANLDRADRAAALEAELK